MKKLLCILTILLFTKMGYAASYTLSGATNPSACNASYAETGTHNSKPYYFSGTYYLYWRTGESAWVVYTSLNDGPPSFYFHRADPDPAGAYGNQNGTGTVVVALDAASDYTVTFTDGKALNGINIAIYEDS
ncbi:MAG: hypothetical protein WC775_06485, partial [Patescibacteria group bacterium]